MVYQYNTETDVYRDIYRQAFENLDEFLGNEAEDTTVHDILFVISLNDIFEQVKKRTALRGRFATDGQGGSLLEKLAMTDDERDLFDQTMPNGSSEVYAKISAWAVDVSNAYKHGVSFGTLQAQGTVTSVTGSLISDTSQALVVSSLIGSRLIITEPDHPLENQERQVEDNTATTISLELSFGEDITGLAYKVINATEEFIVYSLRMPLDWDINMLQPADNAIKEALIKFMLKEWYLINRQMDDFAIEETEYQKELAGKIRPAMFKKTTPIRRPAGLF